MKQTTKGLNDSFESRTTGIMKQYWRWTPRFASVFETISRSWISQNRRDNWPTVYQIMKENRQKIIARKSSKALNSSPTSPRRLNYFRRRRNSDIGKPRVQSIIARNGIAAGAGYVME
jgi:hypothetical protein